ncbi:hypothetical protein BIW11_01347 [Tropilaelaps mercedesae]|uniref:Secreted protein n=1 Tax=Tropilaelaps mercedesae TaxID=418985 RepID=A0A1V9XF66_9ACAR|nr:hypothetical protein BIW11_01347 [Tropilaelaps mercedesae]
MATFIPVLGIGTIAAILLVAVFISEVQCGGYGGWDLGGSYGDHGEHYHVSHAKVAKVSYVKTPIVSTHYVKKPVVSYISKPVKSIHYETKPVVSYKTVPVITKTSHSYGHGW